VVQVQAEQAIVGGQGEPVELLGDAGGDPLVMAPAQRARRAGGVSDALVGAAKYQDPEELVEDHPVGGCEAGGSPSGEWHEKI